MTSVLITGASKGIGRACAQEFARRGYRVIATARDPRSLADLDVDQRLGLDVTAPRTVAAAIEAAGDVDVLVSNAGVIFHAAVEASPVDELVRLFTSNTAGAIRVAQAVLPRMRERRRGRLLFVSSVVGRIVLPGSAGYAASKWALEALVEGLATEIRHFGLDAALLQPGAVASGALDDVLTYTLPGDPYAELLAQRRNSSAGQLSVQEVATAVADAAELEVLPLRLPVGEAAARLLAARHAASDDVPFVPLPLDW